MSDIDWDSLREIAAGAMRRAYAPYSDFPVGAAAIVHHRRCTYGKIRVRGICPAHGPRRCFSQRLPINIAHERHSLTYGLPDAAGGLTRPTNPTTAMMVTR